MKILIKFGGTSVGNGKRINKVCNFVSKLNEKNQIIVVSSALHSTTDELVKLGKKLFPICRSLTGKGLGII